MGGSQLTECQTIERHRADKSSSNTLFMVRLESQGGCHIRAPTMP